MICFNHEVPYCLFLTFPTQGHKKIAGTSSTTGSDRFRLLVSDGRHLNSFAMLATQLNDKVTSGELSDFTVIQITRYITSMVTNADRGDKYVVSCFLDYEPDIRQGYIDLENLSPLLCILICVFVL